MKNIEIRSVEKLEDFQACVNLQKVVWGFDDPYDIVPLPLLVVSQRNGGILLGAYDGPKMIGFVYSLPGEHKGKKLQWSHMLAVLPEYQGSDIGYRLKMDQYRIAEKRKDDVIEWTYDPLESKNAYFNLKKLGCVAYEYEVNIYGETSSPLHQGSPTDRLIAHWPIPSMTKNFTEPAGLPEPPALVTRTSEKDGLRFLEDMTLDSRESLLYMEIPVNIQEVKSVSKQAAVDWRMGTRKLFLHYFDLGYSAYSFLRGKSNRSFYVLKKD